jgi:hypothetical protein
MKNASSGHPEDGGMLNCYSYVTKIKLQKIKSSQ